MRTDLVLKLPIHHDNEGSGAGQRGCCSGRAGSLGGLGGDEMLPREEGDQTGTQGTTAHLGWEWAGVTLGTWWSCQGILFSGEAGRTHETFYRNKYAFALAGLSLRS